MVLDTLNSLKLLQTLSEGRYAELNVLNDAAKIYNAHMSTYMQIALVHNIRSVMLLEVYDSDHQIDGSLSIRCCTRIQCYRWKKSNF